MCIICVKPIGKVVTRRTLKTCFTGNSDGAGMMFSVNGKLVVEKGFFGFRLFYKRFRILERAYPDSNFVLHFRIATSGGITWQTCHPFKVHDKLAFVHNGIFSGLGTTALSDTQIFNRDILQQLPSNFLDIGKAWRSISDYIETSLSKAVFMDNTGKYTIVNEKYGNWDEGIWYSNFGYLPNSYYASSTHYDDACYQDYSGYSTTKKRCVICSCWTKLEDVEWVSSVSFEGKTKTGWICNFCYNFINKEYDCDGCGQSKPRKDMYRNQYGEMICDECSLLGNNIIDYATYGYGDNDSKVCYDCGLPDIYYQSERGGYLCKSCYTRTKTGIVGKQGTCPVCNTVIHLKEAEAYRCPHCRVYLDKNEYLENANETK